MALAVQILGSFLFAAMAAAALKGFCDTAAALGAPAARRAAYSPVFSGSPEKAAT